MASILLLMAVLGGCAGTVDDSNQSTVTLLLQQPSPEGGAVDDDIVDAVVTITGIYLQGGDADGRVWLSQETQTTDLLTLSGDIETLVDDAVVTRGSYHELRFVISGGYIEVADGDGGTRIYASSPDYEGLPEGATVDGELRMPSYEQSGLKVTLPEDSFDIEGEQKIVMVAFDVSESFGHVAGGSGAWVMHPVVHATDVQFTSTVEVEATLGADVALPEGMTMEDIEVRIADAEGREQALLLGNTDDDEAWEAVFDFVNPLTGPWSIELRAPDVTIETDPPQPYSAEVPSGDEVVYAFTITAITAADETSAE